FGNTERTAFSIGEGLNGYGEVKLKRLNEASEEILDGIDLLILGSPTRAFSPTKASINFLKRLPAHGLSNVRIAAFDTRMDLKDVDSKFLRFMAGLFGYAAEPLQKLMIKKGGREAGRPVGFFVKGTEGPMAEGELERAAVWAASLVEDK
ncbi:MAG: flavodoxin family protein, partial [Spirochaetales bacterium]|nr:flavodoxin family protein [Spirochaetales bacterium]